jgi:hypothetical protein
MMSLRRNYTSAPAESTLSSGINSAVTTLDVASATGFPAVPFTIRIGTEAILVEAVSSNTFSSLTRGYDGTTAASHSASDAVAHVGIADDLRPGWARPDFTQATSRSYLFQPLDPSSTDLDIGGSTRLYATPIVIPSTFTITSHQIQVRTTAGVAGTTRVGLYANKNGLPAALLYSGTVDHTTVGLKSYTLGTPVTVQPGVYWGAIQCWGATTLPKYRCTTKVDYFLQHGSALQGTKVAHRGSDLASDTMPNPWSSTADLNGDTVGGVYHGLTGTAA